MAFGALIIGDEILSGRRQDKHLTRVIDLLGARGLRLAWARYAGDDRARLTETLRQTFASGDIVFSFGGIGATPDDHTRQAAAAALGLALGLHPEAEALIRQRFGGEVTPLRLAMGEFPLGSTIVPNPFNHIPGFAIHEHYFLPGFPQMSWPMAEWVLDTHYRHLQHAEPYAEDSLAVLEARESQLVPLMAELEQRFPGVTVFSLPSFGGPELPAHVELGAKGEPAVVKATMAQMREWLDHHGLRYGPRLIER